MLRKKMNLMILCVIEIFIICGGSGVAKYTFDQVKRNVAEIANRDSYTKEFIFELMAAYGRATSAINQLKSGAIDKSTDPNALQQRNKKEGG